jgi:hypothetical protein
MAKSVEIPQDIIDSIIAEVGDDRRLLKQCSLVSSSFLLPSRKQLFSRITLRSDETCQGIHRFLVQNPFIQSFVRAITLSDRRSGNFSQWMNGCNGTSLLAILRLPFCCLEFFSINLYSSLRARGPKPWNWNNFSSELKDALSKIILSSNLKTLSLKGIIKVPITQIVHLTTLELHSVSVNDFDDENSSSLAGLKGVVPMASHTVIDRCVWRLREGLEDCDGYEYMPRTRFPSSPYFSLIRDREGSTQSKFLPFMCRLRFFEIYVNFNYEYDGMHGFDIVLSFLMDSLCISLTSPATLEHLKFNIMFRGQEMENYYYEFYNNLRSAEVWGHLDSITTLPTGSQLQRVDINIDYSLRESDYYREPDEDEVLKTVLDKLPLLRTKGILFVKAFVG